MEAPFVVAVLLGLVALWAVAAAREGVGSHGRWRAAAFGAGVLATALTLLTPLEDWGRDGLVLAQVAQHLALGDVAAPLLLLGLPTLARRRLRELLERPRGRAGRLLGRLFTPVGAVALWAGVTYVWFVPAVHIRTVAPGGVHMLDHASFLLLGALVWLPAFDPRPARAAVAGLTAGGLPWWGRHLYAMISRAAMLPPALALWLSSPESWHPGGGLPFGFAPRKDQVAAASTLVGFEMVLFSLATVLGFVFLSVAEGHRRAVER